MKGLRYILPAMLLLLAGACAKECYENQNALPQAKFVINDSVPREGTMDGIMVYGLGAPNDSVLWDGGSTQSLYLPFRVDSDTTVYIFEKPATEGEEGSVTLRDTVTFTYSRAPSFVSAECGVSFIFHMNRIENTGALIDSVTCPKWKITNENVDNLIIYLRDE